MTALGKIPATADTAGSNHIFAPGMMMHWGGTEAGVPTGWLACAGQELSRTTYAALYNVIGAVYGGDGSTTFKILDLRGRTIAAADNMGNAGAAGRLSGTVRSNAGGIEKVTLTSSHTPSHGHNISAMNQNASHAHGIPWDPGSFNDGSNANKAMPNGSGTHDWTFGLDDIGAAGDHEHGTNNSGGGAAHQNMMPYIVVYGIIKT